MRFSIVTLLTAAMAVTTAASSVEAEKRQLSACVQQCMDDLGIYDGHAISQCRRTCGERP
ncbi:hypothetical protein HER10_EVM0010083 [Colletotrichum scovillei]|uniref:Uncharacterized protein n=1 Tax=Colletotrichum scovillei TaxID=1209932 RepID=A0A9P7QR94_9PEZI|nr:uncharacterized protein HER10_EVM0010083 [Colletotrichum scovillei]KAF4781309.1 hypothetical protein HER10_EVM0010083 [Colletotrichum scovillei]KAG7039179.1 hypothetical protein JMJ78_0004975 [Colletotrichum scovillei]KAG7041359.1 hypothetical protein JMJ77_0003465 [Colletotrichum scovillei]KAG7061387.1 hypothetical protein JMJ76_0000951 [Colletotrichum scovillei]